MADERGAGERGSSGEAELGSSAVPVVVMLSPSLAQDKLREASTRIIVSLKTTIVRFPWKRNSTAGKRFKLRPRLFDETADEKILPVLAVAVGRRRQPF